MNPRTQEGSGPSREEVCSDDIFSLAVSLVELLFDRLPFDSYYMEPDRFHEAIFDLDKFYAKGVDPELRAKMQEEPALEEFLRRALDTSRTTRLKAGQLFKLFHPDSPLPPVNLSPMQLTPATREFLLGLVEAHKKDNSSLALAAEFCEFLRDGSGQAELATSDYNGLALLLHAVAPSF